MEVSKKRGWMCPRTSYSVQVELEEDPVLSWNRQSKSVNNSETFQAPMTKRDIDPHARRSTLLSRIDVAHLPGGQKSSREMSVTVSTQLGASLPLTSPCITQTALIHAALSSIPPKATSRSSYSAKQFPKPPRTSSPSAHAAHTMTHPSTASFPGS